MKPRGMQQMRGSVVCEIISYVPSRGGLARGGEVGRGGRVKSVIRAPVSGREIIEDR